jgi:tRNA(Ile)-lysidine synthase
LQLSSPPLNAECLDALIGKKNLLAFSAGVDSTALFFLLADMKIEFDIAIVDYGIREQSKDEIRYAKELAKRFKKKIFTKEVSLKMANFEKNARDERYNFFKTIIDEYSYQNLITAHQLNDKLEWFLMQLTRGAGLVEIMGYDAISKRENFRLIRPLIDLDKSTLLEYLKQKDITYFVDESNFDSKYERNKIREEFSNSLIDEYKDGIKKSFHYLQEDRKILSNDTLVYSILDLRVLKRGIDDLRSIDKVLKKMGYLLSSLQRDEIKKESELVVGGRFSISKTSEFIFISPYCDTVMPKEFKEMCRVAKIPKKIRAYLFKEGIKPSYLLANFSSSSS